MYDYKKYAILFVDDEELATQYFSEEYEEDFQVLTASGGPEALEILEREAPNIGIVISDQRMPEQTGTELLAKVRRLYPKIVRMLATAYSDLDAAIEAVNSGAISRYVTKPWDVRELKGALLRGMEFFIVQQERDTLLWEKVSALQRLIVNDRIRCLAVMAAGLSHHIRNPMTALKTFLDLVPHMLEDEFPDPDNMKNTDFWLDFSSVTQRESERMMEMVEKMSALVVEPSNNFKENISLYDIAIRAVRRLEGEHDILAGAVSVDMPADLAPVKADPRMIERLFCILIREAAKRNPPEGPVTFRSGKSISVRETPGMSLFVQGDGLAWDEKQVATLFSPFSVRQDALRDPGLDLLPAFFIAHHHNGDLFVHKAAPSGPGFEIHLPLDPGAAKSNPLEKDCAMKIMTHFDTWDSLS